ncbi:hypothetical protein AB0K40_17585 [Nonomuraea bangladeshensis]|uniref:Uncharacterized protein n=1 Tax=Nonomuraea bangladeshensis TaxID=404385 RepID=A0ABV3H568_9ACTN
MPDLVRPYLDWIHLGLQALAGIAATVATVYLWRKARTQPLPEVLTIVAACIATAVSAQGMWRFTGDVLGLDGPLRILLFAFIEVAIITSAVRARRNMRANFSAGIDGIAVWALTALTAVLSSMDARSLPEAVFRLAAPLVAAWLWERGMAIERHRLRGTSGIHWRFTLERVLVAVGLAEATDRTAGDVDRQRRITRLALAAKRARQLRDTGAPDRKQRAALARLDKAFEAAAQHIGLGRDEQLQAEVGAEVAALYSVAGLMDIVPAAAWAPAAVEAKETRSVRWRLASRTEPRTESAPEVVRIARTFEFVRKPAEAPVRIVRRAFSYQPASARTAPVRRIFVVRTQPVSPAPAPVERDVFVREVTAEILAAAGRTEKWVPDYDGLQARSGRSRSWCEKVVADARKAVFRTERRTDGAAA